MAPKTTRKEPKPKLRTIHTSERFFWQQTTSQQFELSVVDQGADYGTREVPKNEIAAQALNEIAVASGRGFFSYLPSRQSWTVKSDESRIPAGRVPGQPGSAYPTIVYTDFVWDAQSAATFVATPHRARYLQSNFIISPSPSQAPVAAIQYASYYRCPVFVTQQESIVIFATPQTFYLLKSSEAARVLGTSGGDKITNPPNLWSNDAIGRFNNAQSNVLGKLRPFELVSLEAVYKAVRNIHPQGLRSTLCSAGVKALIPRAPPAAAAVGGVALGGGTSADPHSRKGETRKSRPRTSDSGVASGRAEDMAGDDWDSS